MKLGINIMPLKSTPPLFCIIIPYHQYTNTKGMLTYKMGATDAI